MNKHEAKARKARSPRKTHHASAVDELDRFGHPVHPTDRYILYADGVRAKKKNSEMCEPLGKYVEYDSPESLEYLSLRLFALVFLGLLAVFASFVYVFE